MSELWLGLDGALGAFSAAVIDRDESVAPRTAAAAGNDALERGLAIVDEVLAGVPLRSFHAIAVGTGPGTFTGLRIALSYAKSLAFASRLPLVGVSSYDAVTTKAIARTHAAFVHGRAGIACARLRIRASESAGVRDEGGDDGASDAGGIWAETIVCGTYAEIANAFAARLAGGTNLPSFGAAEGVAPALGERGITVLAVAPQPPSPALAVVRRALACRLENPHALRADYGEAHYAERNHAPERSGVEAST